MNAVSFFVLLGAAVALLVWRLRSRRAVIDAAVWSALDGPSLALDPGDRLKSAIKRDLRLRDEGGEQAEFDAAFQEIAAAAEALWRHEEGLRALNDYARQYPMKQRPGVVAPADSDVPTSGEMQ